MLLSSLTPNELERLAFTDPFRPGLAAAVAQVCRDELASAQEDIARLEQQVTALEDYNAELDE